MLKIRSFFSFFFADTSISQSTIIVSIIVSFVLFVLLIVVVAVVCVRRERRRAAKSRRRLQALNPPSSDSVEPAIKPLDDEWEIDRGDLMLLEKIGEGFFGVVLKAKVFHRQPLESQRWMVRRSRTGTNIGGNETKSIVACKMLKGNVTF